MNDNDVIKALECLHKRILQSKFAEEVTEIEIIGLVYALDIINRQKATIKEFDEKIVMQMGLIKYQKEDIDRLTVELQGMRGAANSYKMHYINAMTEIEELKKKMTQEGEKSDA